MMKLFEMGNIREPSAVAYISTDFARIFLSRPNPEPNFRSNLGLNPGLSMALRCSSTRTRSADSEFARAYFLSDFWAVKLRNSIKKQFIATFKIKDSLFRTFAAESAHKRVIVGERHYQLEHYLFFQRIRFEKKIVFDNFDLTVFI